MTEPVGIKEEILKFKCSFCNLLLSVPPIMIISPDGDKFKCGRCTDIDNIPNLTKLIFIEGVGKHITWPCSFEGCTDLLEWDHVGEHEISCGHKKLSCPLEDCGNEISFGTIANHIENEHDDDIIHQIENQRVTIPLNFSQEEEANIFETKLLLLKEDTLQFLLFVHKRIVVLTCIGKSEKYQKYTVHITDSEQNQQNGFLSYENQNIQSFNNQIHCLKCFNGNCSSVTHSYATTDQTGIGLKIDWNKISRLFPDSIKITFILTSDPWRNISLEIINSLNTNHFSELRRSLECIVCTHIMASPIFNCAIGHSVCHQCKYNIDYCPSCRMQMTESKNFALQSIIGQIQFPCKFWINGCNFMDRIINVMEHEANCPSMVV